MKTGTLRVFAQWHDTSLSFCLHMQRVAKTEVEQRREELDVFYAERDAEAKLLPELYGKIQDPEVMKSLMATHERLKGNLERLLKSNLDEALRRLRTEWDWINRQGPKLLLDLVKGLEVLHRQSIIHRDLCPDNVFVSGDSDDSLTAKPRSIRTATLGTSSSGDLSGKEVYKFSIGNFYLAKRITKNNHATTVVGSIRYRAPEVIWSPTYKLSADIWSLGMIAYTLATGLVPFEGVPDLFLPSIIASGEKPQVPPDCSMTRTVVQLIEIYNECTQLRPENRPSLLEIKQALTLGTPLDDIRANSSKTADTNADVIDDNPTLPIFEFSTTASSVLKQFYNSRYNLMKEGEKEKDKKRHSIFHRLKKEKQPKQSSERDLLSKGNNLMSNTSELKFLLFFSKDILLQDFYFLQCIPSVLYYSIDCFPAYSLGSSGSLIGRLQGPGVVTAAPLKSGFYYNLPLEWPEINSKFGAYGHAISTYPYNTHLKTRLGDPICDKYEFLRFENMTIGAVADGCNWGVKPKIAAERACQASLGYLEENAKKITTLEEAAFYLVRSVAIAHNKIVAGEKENDATFGTTTLICAITLPLSKFSNDHLSASHVLIWASVGDCKMYLYSDNEQPTFLDLSVKKPGSRTSPISSSPTKISPTSSPPPSSPPASSPPSSPPLQQFGVALNNAFNREPSGTFGSATSSTSSSSDKREISDPGGRLGIYVNEEEPIPDLRNFTVNYCTLTENDIVVFLSDGVHDNLDPDVLQVDPAQWNPNSQDAAEARRRFAESLALQLIQEEASKDKQADEKAVKVEPHHITKALLSHCWNVTQEGRVYMETHPRSNNFKFKGKCDHATSLAFRVKSPSAATPTISRPTIKSLNQ
eukprot:TRINITY_DN3065_c0_g1_i1.p1 TRINITY_DN3065_c0_g1~~TRINITY_DN3065_c0_g1_i1.p1  ORF type:complete len:868 (-),score=168.77 TRINITY_DN3065_c0_g1_i1:9-2612(-)